MSNKVFFFVFFFGVFFVFLFFSFPFFLVFLGMASMANYIHILHISSLSLCLSISLPLCLSLYPYSYYPSLKALHMFVYINVCTYVDKYTGPSKARPIQARGERSKQASQKKKKKKRRVGQRGWINDGPNIYRQTTPSKHAGFVYVVACGWFVRVLRTAKCTFTSTSTSTSKSM